MFIPGLDMISILYVRGHCHTYMFIHHVDQVQYVCLLEVCLCVHVFIEVSNVPPAGYHQTWLPTIKLHTKGVLLRWLTHVEDRLIGWTRFQTGWLSDVFGHCVHVAVHVGRTGMERAGRREGSETCLHLSPLSIVCSQLSMFAQGRQ